MICDVDCQQKSAFKDAAFFCQDELPRLTILVLKHLGQLRINTRFSFAKKNRNSSYEDKTYHFDCLINLIFIELID